MYYVDLNNNIYTIKKKIRAIAVSAAGIRIIGGYGGGGHQGDGHPVRRNGQSRGCRRGLDIGGMGKTGGGGAGVVFTTMERVGRETDLTTGFPDAENGGGEALAAVGRR